MSRTNYFIQSYQIRTVKEISFSLCGSAKLLTRHLHQCQTKTHHIVFGNPSSFLLQIVFVQGEYIVYVLLLVSPRLAWDL